MTEQPSTVYKSLGMFSGAGGLDLGFEQAGFEHVGAMDINPWCVETLRANRPSWHVLQADATKYQVESNTKFDVLLAGFPCQGFSIGGKRESTDERNALYKEVLRVAASSKPRAIVLENVLNLGAMLCPGSDENFAEHIANEIRKIGYHVHYGVFKLCEFGVPQTRRRFIFIAFREPPPQGYHLPKPHGFTATTIRPFLYDFANGSEKKLPNHDPVWGFKSQVHLETGEKFDSKEEVVPVRFSRTASDSFPIKSFDAPFQTVDTATVWGWAQGNVKAVRVEKDRKNGKFIRNPESTNTLWRITASRLRRFTSREYARLQTFPDTWIFKGKSRRDFNTQIGNAVPVAFAKIVGENVRDALTAQDNGTPFPQIQVPQKTKPSDDMHI